jgi:MSHA biogenesis protein MshJ
MIRQQWENITARVDAMSLRERAMIFAAAAFLLVSLVNTLLLDPMLLKQKNLSNQVVQQQEKMKEIQAQIDAIQQARSTQGNSPQHQQLKRLKQELAEGVIFLNSNRENLVQPEKMADLLRQVLGRNANLQLLALQTLPVTPLLDKENSRLDTAAVASVAAAVAPESQIFKHGVEMTVRGNYLDLLKYLNTLERLPTQMFWGKVKMEVVQYPAAELTLTLYTLSLDKIWLQV